VICGYQKWHCWETFPRSTSVPLLLLLDHCSIHFFYVLPTQCVLNLATGSLVENFKNDFVYELDRTLLANSVALFRITEAPDSNLVDKLTFGWGCLCFFQTSHTYTERFPQNRPQLLPVYFRFIITIIPSFDVPGYSPSVVKWIWSKYSSTKFEFIHRVLKSSHRVVKKSLCTLMITIQKVTSNVASVPRQSPDSNCHAELYSRRRVQYSTVHIPNVFCDDHL